MKSGLYKYTFLIKAGAEKLKLNNIKTYQLDARLLLMHVLKISREELLLRSHEVISALATKQYMRLIARRAKDEPLAYITNKKEFFGLDFYVNKDTLIPRPDSECLIEEVLKNASEVCRVLDLGTGSGCLLITLLKHLPLATGVGVDISASAVRVAKKNAVLNQIGASRIRFVNKSWNSLNLKERFDIIISNPPYIKSADIPKLGKSVKVYEPHGALDGGHSGYDAYKSLVDVMHRHMKLDGFVVVEHGLRQSAKLQSLFKRNGLQVSKVINDLSGRRRGLVLRK